MAQSMLTTPPFTLAGSSSSATTEPVPTSTSHDASTTVEPSALSAVATAPISTPPPTTITIQSTTQYPALSLASHAALPWTSSLATTFVSTTFITVQAAPAATSSAGAAKGDSRSPSQLILGVAAGGSTALIIVLLLIVLLLRRRRQNRNSFEEAPTLPPVAQAPPLIVPLPASADPSGEPGTIIRALSNATSLKRSLPQQAAITPSGTRLVPREEPGLTMTSGESTTATRDFAVEGKSMEVPLVPPRNPLRPRRPKSRILATPPRMIRKAGTRLSTIPGSVASSPGHTGTANLTVPSGTQRSRTSSYTSLGARSDSVYSLDTNGQRRRSDPFSWQNVVAPHTPRPIPKYI